MSRNTSGNFDFYEISIFQPAHHFTVDLTMFGVVRLLVVESSASMIILAFTSEKSF